ncbi:lysophospholipase [Calycina marina]|uniref:Lysophospholipase n=1 Tax=Calycina marina TaxID=1763456 RepID=A0A9P7Z650_9HELO|nr:lysophospholipase [Calycina marina]
MSAVTSQPSFMLRNVPYPIITAQAVDLSGTVCAPPVNASHYEFTPYEFGSWDPTIGAFTPTKYLGSSLSAGKPVSTNSCITNYDNLGFVIGTSSALLNDPGIGTDEVYDATFANFCTIPDATVSTDPDDIAVNAGIAQVLAIPNVELLSVADLYAPWPNPFYNLTSAPQVSDSETLSMVDGGESGQVNPIVPMLLPSRQLDVIIVNDNTDGTDNFPSGQELVNTYEQAKVAGLTRMPYVPPFEYFAAHNLTSHPNFFGCQNDSVATIIWVPNAALTPIGGNTSTNKIQYSEAETVAMVANGAAVMSQNNSEAWAKCLACAFMDKSNATNLPAVCTTCFTEYCVDP